MNLCMGIITSATRAHYKFAEALVEMFTLMSNNLDQDETPSNSMFHSDAMCMFARKFELRMDYQAKY